MTGAAGPQARILVVDDSATQRSKMAIAVRRLGHRPEEAEDGEAALTALGAGGIDLVILDLLMPRVDGFAVLAAMKADPDLATIPVLVISSLEEADEVARAISLGAADVLTKAFDPVLFAARVDASLERARLHRAERDTLAQARRIARAARVVEVEGFEPSVLELGDLAAREDAIGDLARVFAGMAVEIHRRERSYARQIVLLRGACLLLVIAIPFGLVPALASDLAATSLHPLGITAYLMLGGAVLLGAVSLARRRPPSLVPAHLAFGLRVAVIGMVLPQVAILFATGHLPASLVVMVIALEPAFVLGLAALLEPESVRPSRVVGACLAVLAVALAALPVLGGPIGSPGALAFAAAVAAALLHAIRSVLVTRETSHEDDAVQTVTLITALAAAVTFPLAAVLGVLPSPRTILEVGGLALPVLAVVLTGCTIGYVFALRRTGAAFASSYAAPLIVTGILWAMLILDETPSRWIWLAVPCMIGSLYLVAPRDRQPVFARR